MKKRELFLLIIGTLIFALTGCNNEDKSDKDNEKVDDKNLIVCLTNTLGGYIVTEKNEFNDISLDDFTNKIDKVMYYKASYTDENNMYALVKTNEREVIKDFDLYFSNKYDIYQTYTINDDIYIYIHNNLNDMNLDELKKCAIK